MKKAFAKVITKPAETMGKHRKNTLRRIRLVLDIVEKHYEPGNNAKNYRKVWERYVNPVYPCCYRTMLSYLKTPGSELESVTPAEDKRQLKLF